jgi:serpin B
VNRRRWTIALGLAAGLVVSAACGAGGGEERSGAPRREPTAGQAQRTAPGTTLLGARLLGELTARRGNVALSPSLLAAQLGTIRAGARTDTAVELDALFTSPATPDPPSVADLGGTVALLDGRSGSRRSETRSGRLLVDHDIALWLQRGTEVDDVYLEASARDFGTGVRLVDFRSAPEVARESVNRWAVNASNGRVSQLLSRGQVSAATRLLSTGMLGFTAPWQFPFDTSATRESTFRTDSGRDVRVTMMRLTAPAGVGVAAGPDWEAVSLPYLGGELTMVVIVPAPGAIDAVQGRLVDGLLDEVRRAARPRPVTLRLPRVAFTSELALVDELVQLGARQLFDIDAADLTGMAPAERLALTDVVQQVFLAIDEGGTGAGAATVTTQAASVPAGSPAITADRPFLVAVVDRLTGTPLLLGRVGDPTG